MNKILDSVTLLLLFISFLVLGAGLGVLLWMLEDDIRTWFLIQKVRLILAYFEIKLWLRKKGILKMPKQNNDKENGRKETD